MNPKSEKPCGCGKIATPAEIREALNLWNAAQSEATRELPPPPLPVPPPPPPPSPEPPGWDHPYPPPVNEDGTIDTTSICADETDQRLQVAVWARYYLSYVEWESSAAKEAADRAIRDSKGADYTTCRFNA